MKKLPLMLASLFVGLSLSANDSLDNYQVVLKNGASITAPLIRQNDKGIILDMGDDVLRLAKSAYVSIAKLEDQMAGARVIDESQMDASKILVLSKVKIKNQTNGMEMNYTLVADGEADLASGKISVNSPIGQGLLGKTVGDVAEIQVPNGTIKFDIIEISR